MNNLELIRVLAKEQKYPVGEIYHCSRCDDWTVLAACHCAVANVLQCHDGRGCDEGLPLDVICRKCKTKLTHCHKWVFSYKKDNTICSVCSKRFWCWTTGSYMEWTRKEPFAHNNENRKTNMP